MSESDALTHYQVLGLEPGASEEDIRRAFRRMRQLFDADSLALYGLYRSLDVQQEITRLKRAVEVLLDPIARQQYDHRHFGRRAPTPVARREDAPPALAPRPRQAAPTSRVQRPADPLAAAGLTGDAPIDGAALARVREACGIRLEEIAERTKISMYTLRCIELEQFEDLPAGVYLRGFLKQFAGMLGLPADRVVQEYMDAVDAWHAALSRRR
ncbi:MAG: helix-turn-helix domain-containing protein [bacterium]